MIVINGIRESMMNMVKGKIKRDEESVLRQDRSMMR